jgi:hypothetical protein
MLSHGSSDLSAFADQDVDKMKECHPVARDTLNVRSLRLKSSLDSGCRERERDLQNNLGPAHCAETMKVFENWKWS